MTNIPTLSYWESDLQPRECDVCIVGGGFTAAWTAFFLSRIHPGIRIVIIDELTLSRGASTRNAGFLCYGSPSEILEDIDAMGEEKALNLVRDRYRGLRKIESLVPPGSASISWNGGFELFTDQQSDLLNSTVNQLPYLNELMKKVTGRAPYSLSSKNPLSKVGPQNSAAIHIDGEGLVHPAALLKYISELNQSAGVRQMDGFRVENILADKNASVVDTNRGHSIKAKKVLIATNGFYNRMYQKETEILPARNQVIMLSTDRPFRLTGSWHCERGYIYFREVNGMLLIGGGRHWAKEEENTSRMELNPMISDKLKQYALDYILPEGTQVKEYTKWSGIMGVGPSKSPILRWDNENILSAVRLSGMGVALSPILGEEAAIELSKSLC